MKKNNVCPVCGVGNLTRKSELDTLTYKGKSKEYTHFFSVCDFCHVDQAGAEELKINKRAVIEAKKIIDGLLTGSQVKRIRVKLGLNQADAAKVFGGGVNAFTKYESDDVMQSEAMDKLIRNAFVNRELFQSLLNSAGLDSRFVKHDLISRNTSRGFFINLESGKASMEYGRKSDVINTSKQDNFVHISTH